MLNYIHAHHKISKIQTQPQEFSGSDISLYKATCVIFSLNNIKVPTGVPSDIYPDTSNLLTQKMFATLISCELEPEITIPTSWNIFVLADLAPYLINLDNSDAVDKYDF